MRSIWVLLLTVLVSCVACLGCGQKAAVEEQAPGAPVPSREETAPQEAPPSPEPMSDAPSEQAPAAERYVPTMVAEPEVAVLAEEGAGKLLRVGELLVCVMEGTPSEMGYQHGRLLADHVRSAMTERYMAKTLYGRGYTKEYVYEQSARMEKHFPPEYIEEMKGLVEGLQAAGVQDITYEDIRTGVCVAELQHYSPGEPPGCSNFAVFGRWTTDGRLLHGRNLDWSIKGQAQDDAVVLVWRPKNGIPFMMVGWAGSIGSVSGMNAKGITIGEMTSGTPDSTFDGMPLFVIMRRILEKASTLEEAVAIMQQGPRTTGWNFVIGDAQIPDARALEVDAKTCEVFAPMDPKEGSDTGHMSLPDAVRRTNHPCGGEQLKKVAMGYATRTNIPIPDWEAAKPLVLQWLQSNDSWARYTWLGKQIQAMPGRIDVQQALELLSNGPVFCDATLHSWVFDPKNQTAYVSNAGVDPVETASRRPYYQIDLKEWFQ